MWSSRISLIIISEKMRHTVLGLYTMLYASLVAYNQ